jgi:hypothetical protein
MAFESIPPSEMSQRTFATKHGVPRTTLQYWLARKSSIDACEALVSFFESPDGLAFLHRLIIALQFVMSFLGGCGLRLVAMVIELSGLSPFVANSFGVRQKLGTQMQQEIRTYAKQQRAKLSKHMPSKPITVCEDETFHPEICLVAIEPVSNFILLEEYAEGRDAATWTAALNQAIEALPVRVIQSTSDEGKGLLSHVQSGLGAHHSPDIFHVQQELSRATSIALAGQVRKAEKAVIEATKQTEALQTNRANWEQTKQGPGRPPDFEARIAKAQTVELAAQQSLDVTRERQETARQAIRSISTSYHPVDLTSGALRTTEQVTAELESHFTDIKTMATEASLPERCLKGIDKAHRVLPGLSSTMTFFHSEVDAQIDTLSLTHADAQVVKQILVPAAYLEKAATKAQPADNRPPLKDLAEKLRAEAHSKIAHLSVEKCASTVKAASDCADIFQRSSSCVEGRNGQLALCHHSLHHISPERLEALTAVHNYFIQRPDGTTAAERFFENRPDKMFNWLLENLEMPSRPAAKRKRVQNATEDRLN